MAALTNPSLMLLVISLAIIIGSCSAACDFNNITVGTTRTGRFVNGKEEWTVEVINNCHCAISHVVLRCIGFKTEEPVDPSIMVKQGDHCIILRGQPIPPSVVPPVKFTYADWPPHVLVPIKGQGC